ncbi:MAG: circularly permuted type 2 ATP-grasp protein, partial [Rhodoglobus sp.]|nr:circularly permuted type 2 ATP-grasp protein [Rhodoglobus sp.]
VDDEFLDPLQFRADSMLGSPGLLLAARLGNVTIANAVGNGVADDKLVYTYLPDLMKYYLGEDPIIPNVQTWRLEEPGSLEEVLDRLHELVIKPVDGSGGKGLVIGPDASADELADLKVRLLRDPRGWIAQPVVQLSTIPTLVDDGMRPRHADLRPFAVNDGKDIWVLPGGLTRVALPEGELVVNSSQGGGSKDTWVVGQDLLQVSRHSIQGLVAGQAAATDESDSLTIIAAEHVQDQAPQDRPLGHGQQEQQQQQQSSESARSGRLRPLRRAQSTGTGTTSTLQGGEPCGAASPSPCSGSGGTSSAPTARRASSTCTCSFSSKTRGSRRTSPAGHCCP